MSDKIKADADEFCRAYNRCSLTDRLLVDQVVKALYVLLKSHQDRNEEQEKKNDKTNVP